MCTRMHTGQRRQQVAPVHYSCDGQRASAQMYLRPSQNSCPQISTKMPSKSAADRLSCACVRSRMLRSRIQEIRDCSCSNFCSNQELLFIAMNTKQPFLMSTLKLIQVPLPLVACPTGVRPSGDLASLLQSTRPTAEPQHAYKSRPTPLCTHPTSH